eukprot:g6191.t1
MSSTKYDVVVYGATSFAGQLTCEHYLTTYGASPPTFKWAMAARSEAKLAALKERLASEIDPAASTLPTIVADCQDEEAVGRMVSQAKVIVTTVGPYAHYGSKLVAACVAAGVHCCDLTGESLWVKDMIDKHHEEAERTGAKIVPSCGFDSIPADMGTLMCVDHMKRTHGVMPEDVRYYLKVMEGGASGGTIASVLSMCEQAWSGGREVTRKINNPLLLTPGAFGMASSPGGLGYDSIAKSWTSTSVFASHDAKIVFRSAGMLGYPAGFRYKEVVRHKGLIKGFVPAVLSTVALSIGGLFMLIPITRNFIAKKFLPAPGEGPSKEVRDNGFFWIDYHASGKTQEGKEVVCHGKVGSDKGDPGYKETGKMLAECGLCLALDDLESTKGGILTTAAAMGMPLVDSQEEPSSSNYTGWSPELAQGAGAGGRRDVAAPDGAILENTLSMFAEIQRDILKRWGPKYAESPIFSGGMEFSDEGKVVEDKMLNAVLEQRGFLAVFTGISTTAGHDNLYEQSYPILLNGTMGRLMAAAGVPFEAINVAMGNTRVVPYSLCVDAHAGLQADIISWDMYMMVAGKHPPPPAVELFVRSASVLPRRPAVLLTDASPDNKLCPARTKRLKVRNDGLYAAGQENDLMEVYREFGLHRMTPSDLVPENTCGDERFANDNLYNASMKDYPRPASWHAGPQGHQLVADMLFMHYAKVFIGALERLEVAMPGVTASKLRGSEAEQTSIMRSLREALDLGPGAVSSSGDDEGDAYMGAGRGDILPPPASCADWRFCSGAGDYRCANSYFPLAGDESSRLLDMVSEGTPAVLNANRSEFFAEPAAGRWAVTLNEMSPKLIEYLGVAPPEGFHHPIDMKWVLVGDNASGPIDFEFETIGFPPERGGVTVVGEERGDHGWEEGAAEEEEEKKGGQEIVEEWGQQRREGEGDEDKGRRRATGQSSSPPGLRVVVCKPDFIDRRDFTNSKQLPVGMAPATVDARIRLDLAEKGPF